MLDREEGEGRRDERGEWSEYTTEGETGEERKRKGVKGSMNGVFLRQ